MEKKSSLYILTYSDQFMKEYFERAYVTIITFEFSTTCILFYYFYNIRQSLDLEIRSVAYEYTV